jgi:hypothetical protein
MTRKMRATVVEQFGKPLVFREVDIPHLRVFERLERRDVPLRVVLEFENG